MARRGNGSRKRTLEILAAIPAAIKAEVSATIRAEAEAIVATQKRLVAVDDGDLRRSIRVEFGDVALASSANLSGGAKRGRGRRSPVARGDADLTATIVAGDAVGWYARFVEFGTAPHRIAPKRLNLLRKGSLAIGGRLLAPGKAVMHPGARARPFFYGPFRARKKSIKRAVSRSIRRAVERSVT